MYKYKDSNELDRLLFDGLVKLNLNTEISLEQVKMLRFIQYIHMSVLNWATIRQILDSLKFQALNGAKIHNHYLCNRSISEMIGCMGQGRKNLDYEHVSSSEFYSICEDAQTLNRVGARGFIVRVWNKHKVLFICILMDMKRC